MYSILMYFKQMHRLVLDTLIVIRFLEFRRFDQFHVNKWALNLFLLYIYFFELRWIRSYDK